MVIISHRSYDSLEALRHQEMTTALEPLFAQMHDIIEKAGFRPFGELQIVLPRVSRDIDTRISWERKT